MTDRDGHGDGGAGSGLPHEAGGAGESGGHGGRGDDHGDGHGEGGHGEEHGPDGGPVGTIAGGAAEVLEGVGALVGEEDEDAKKGLETAAAVAKGVQDAAKAGQQIESAAGAIQGGNVGEAASGLGGALGDAGAGVGGVTGAVGNLFGEGSEERRALGEASRVASTVGQIARGVGEVIEGGAELLEGLLGERHEVHYELEIEGSDIHWTVHSVNIHEALMELSTATIEASCAGSEHPDEDELLAKDVGVIIVRGEERRSFRGIVRHCSVRLDHARNVVTIDAAPALWLASETLDSRIYQDKKVPDLVEQVVQELIGDRHRSVRNELTETYEPHEYLVQHRESHWAFLRRLCEEEGIFLYFDHDEEDQEILVLADSNDNRPQARADHDGIIDFEENENQAAGREVATHVSRFHRVGTTDVTVRGRDWTNPGARVEQEHTDRASWNGPRLEHYDHDHAVRHHGYEDGGGSYQSHTASRVARMHTERLDIARQTWTIQTTVVSAMPGHTFELQGADSHDRRYLIVAASSGGEQNDHGGEYHNTLTCIPADMPYRPPAPQRRLMHGPETATVVGPPGEEIHTDRHGRIKVQFHWDRQGKNDEHSSVWIRVNYGWAGPGWGQIFIPRIGMEVIVAFLGGDPDRPIVMGCLYNGANPPPYPLPDDKTKSTIKTNSSVGGGGYNELRFEDKKGQEEVFIHAEKDFNEVVENNHTTRVKNCQTNTVDVDQTETVKRDQTMTVERDRTKTVDRDETNQIKRNRETTVGPDGGNDTLTVKKTRTETIEGPEDRLTVTAGNKYTNIDAGKWDIATSNRFFVAQREETQLKLEDSITGGTQGDITFVSGSGAVRSVHGLGGDYQLTANDRIVLQAAGTSIDVHAATAVTVHGPTKVSLTSDTEVVLQVGASQISITPSKITISSPTVELNGQSLVDVKSGGLVKLKC